MASFPPQALATGGQSLHNPKILIVDDDQALLTVLPETLRLYIGPVDVAVCLSPRLAVARVEAEHFDVVLADIRMPEMTGLELLKQIKQIAPQTAVIMMSGHADETIAQEAFDAGAVNFLSKPFQGATLRQTFQQLFAGSSRP